MTDTSVHGTVKQKNFLLCWLRIFDNKCYFTLDRFPSRLLQFILDFKPLKRQIHSSDMAGWKEVTSMLSSWAITRFLMMVMVNLTLDILVQSQPLYFYRTNTYMTVLIQSGRKYILYETWWVTVTLIMNTEHCSVTDYKYKKFHRHIPVLTKVV